MIEWAKQNALLAFILVLAFLNVVNTTIVIVLDKPAEVVSE